MKVTKDMTIAQIIQIDQNIIPILMDAGMHCIGCPSAQGESLVEAAFVHGIDVDRLVEEINQFLSAEQSGHKKKAGTAFLADPLSFYAQTLIFIYSVFQVPEQLCRG